MESSEISMAIEGVVDLIMVYSMVNNAVVRVILRDFVCPIPLWGHSSLSIPNPNLEKHCTGQPTNVKRMYISIPPSHTLVFKKF